MKSMNACRGCSSGCWVLLVRYVVTIAAWTSQVARASLFTLAMVSEATKNGSTLRFVFFILIGMPSILILRQPLPVWFSIFLSLCCWNCLIILIVSDNHSFVVTVSSLPWWQMCTAFQKVGYSDDLWWHFNFHIFGKILHTSLVVVSLPSAVFRCPVCKEMVMCEFTAQMWQV